MINVEVVYDHKKKYKNGGSAIGPIEARITFAGKVCYISTGVRVHYKNFIGGRVINQPDAVELNNRLAMVVVRIQQEVNGYLERGASIDFAAIRKNVWSANADNEADAAPLLDWFDEQIGVMRLRPGTIVRYKAVMNRLQEFGELRRWQDVTVEKIYKWDAWLHKLKKSPAGNGLSRWGLCDDGRADACGENISEQNAGHSGSDGRCNTSKQNAGHSGEDEYLSDSAVYNYHKCVKCLLNRAVACGRLDANPYDRLRGQFKRGEKESVEFLTEEEMQRFIDTKPPVGTEMDVAHDLFIFQMFTGLAYADAQAFNIKDYKKVAVGDDGRADACGENGSGKVERWVNIGERVKTGVPYVSQLLPPVVEVLKKYGWKVPRMANAKYNICLKALGMVAGIDRPLHSHLARHTFATWMLRHGVPIEHVSKMLGHTNIQQTMKYAKVQPMMIYDDFERVGKMFE